MKAKDLKKSTKYAREVDRLNTEILKRLGAISTKEVAGVMSSIHKGIDIGQRSSLTASERKRLAPTMLDKMEARFLKMLAGWSILDIECLLEHRVVPEAKRRANLT